MAEVVLPLRKGRDGNFFYFLGEKGSRTFQGRTKRTSGISIKIIGILINLLTESLLARNFIKDRSTSVKSVLVLANINVK